MERRSDCPLSCSLDVIGDRWTLLILRDVLFFDKKHYKDFLNSHEGISTNILANRLSKLVSHGLLTKQKDAVNGLMYNYYATEKAKDLMQVLMQLGKWGNKHIKNTITIPPLHMHI